MICKSLLFLLAALAMVVALTDEEQFAEFKKEFEKTYDTPEEEEKRFKIFQENLRFIEENNKKYDKGEVSSRLDITPFTDLSADEWSHRNHELSPLPIALDK
ncbi:crustapain-like [Diorhabda sublineata]|uniref:crustapain-like n=1 Tax=Diorhabda sublineata TaxID=1163346 RepID=UPI0024E13580|nr:crustapain-like [Diorhabda sublineata]